MFYGLQIYFDENHGGSTSVGVMSTGIASPARESNGTVATKCECSIYGFSQGSMVLHHGLQHCSNEGCMMFMRGH